MRFTNGFPVIKSCLNAKFSIVFLNHFEFTDEKWQLNFSFEILLPPESILIDFKMPQVGFTIKDSQKFVNQQELPSIPARKDGKTISENVKEADNYHIDNLIVLFINSPLENYDQKEDVIGTEHIEQNGIVPIAHQRR